MQDKDTQYFDPGPPGYCWLTGYRFTYKHSAQADQQRRRRKLKDAARKREKKAQKEIHQNQKI